MAGQVRGLTASLSQVLGVGQAREPEATDAAVEPGYLVVRASGASAARLAIDGAPRTGVKAEPEQIQLAMRASLPSYLPAGGISLRYPECALRAHPGVAGHRAAFRCHAEVVDHVRRAAAAAVPTGAAGPSTSDTVRRIGGAPARGGGIP